MMTLGRSVIIRKRFEIQLDKRAHPVRWKGLGPNQRSLKKKKKAQINKINTKNP